MNAREPRRTLTPDRAARPVRLVEESEALAAAPDRAAFLSAPRGARLSTHPAGYVSPEALSDYLATRLGGAPRPDWFSGRHGMLIGGSSLVRASNAWCLPGYGAVVADDAVLKGSAGGALTRWPDLSGFPGFSVRDGLLFSPPAASAALNRASLFCPWGGYFNYGHFLLDGLASLSHLEESGLLELYPPITAPLKPWHRELLGMAFPHLEVREVGAEALRVDDVLYSSTMDHFLGAPNDLLARLRERFPASPEAAASPRWVYLSRRAQPMRPMVNERLLEAALRERGFKVVQPERLPPKEQIALMRGADIIVAPTGAGLSNALFAARGAKVIEIMPESYASHWVLALCRQIGVEWRGYLCPSPCSPAQLPWRRRLRNYVFAYQLPLQPFLEWLDLELSPAARG